MLGSVDALVDGVTAREQMVTAGKSGALLERVLIGGEWRVLKHLDPERDWTLRAAAFPGTASVALWREGVLGALPDCFAQPILAVASDGVRAALLMEDVARWLLPADDSVIAPEVQDRLLDHMAALHAAFWDDPVDVVPQVRRYLELSPSMAAAEADRGSPDLVPRLVAEGWPRLTRVAPRAAEVVVPLAHDPGPLVDALATTPETFVHGNWKLDNLGTTPDGRTILLDWELPGRAAGASDLAWYLAVNCRRIPTSKERAIETYRTALERHGVSTEPWWDRQLALCLLGALVQFGWEKALGGYDDELAWWEERARAAAPLVSR